MKTKTYDLTAIEVLAIRDALCESKQQWKKFEPNSPLPKKVKAATTALYEQFAIVGREGEK